MTATIETVATPLAAVVRHVSPSLDPASGMIFVEAELAPGTSSADLRPGLAGRVRL